MGVSVFKVVEGLRTKSRAESRARTRVAATRRPRRTTARRCRERVHARSRRCRSREGVDVGRRARAVPVGGPPPDPSPRGFCGEEMRKKFDSRARGNGRAARREGRRRVAGQSSRVLTFRLGREFLVSRRDDRRDGRERRLRPSVSGSGSRVMVHPPRGAKWTGGRVRARRRKTSSARIDASRVDSDATREPPASLAYRRSTRSSSAAASVPREANMPRQLPSRGLPLPSLGSFNADIFAPANPIFFHDCLPIRPIFRVEEICAPRAHWTRVPIPPKQGRRRKSPRVAGSRPSVSVEEATTRLSGGRAGRACEARLAGWGPRARHSAARGAPSSRSGVRWRKLDDARVLARSYPGRSRGLAPPVIPSARARPRPADARRAG